MMGRAGKGLGAHFTPWGQLGGGGGGGSGGAGSWHQLDEQSAPG